MAVFGGLGKFLGLGSTKDFYKFQANAAASTLTGGAIPIQTSPFEQEEPQMISNPFEEQRRQQAMSNNQMASSNSGGSFFGNLGQSIGSFGSGVGNFFQDIQPLTNLLGGGFGAPSSAGGSARTIQRQGPEEEAFQGAEEALFVRKAAAAQSWSGQLLEK